LDFDPEDLALATVPGYTFNPKVRKPGALIPVSYALGLPHRVLAPPSSKRSSEGR
jgi:hypothetical protein